MTSPRNRPKSNCPIGRRRLVPPCHLQRDAGWHYPQLKSVRREAIRIKADSIVSLPVSMLVPPQARAEIPNVLERLRRGEGSIDHYEAVCLHKDGHRIRVSMPLSSIKDRHGTVVGVAAIARDVTEQRQTEAALRQSEERFRVALKSAPTVVLQSRPGTAVHLINSPVLAWASDGWTWTYGHGGPWRPGSEPTHGHQAGGAAHRRGTRTETTVTFKGETRHFDLTVEPLRDRKGACVGLHAPLPTSLN